MIAAGFHIILVQRGREERMKIKESWKGSKKFGAIEYDP